MKKDFNKIFCIGLSKTGTKSLHVALQILKFTSCHDLHGGTSNKMGYINQATVGDYNWEIINKFDAFSDIPIPIYYKGLDKAFPNSKFILTIRDKKSWLESCERWFNKWKITLKHLDGLKKEDNIITIQSVGFIRILVYGISVFNYEVFSQVYDQHIENVYEYFKNRPGDLLTLNICNGDGWEKLCKFLNQKVIQQPFPYKGKNNG